MTEDQLIKQQEIVNCLRHNLDELQKWLTATEISDLRVDLAKLDDGDNWSKAVHIIPESFRVLRDLHIAHYTKSIAELKQKLNNV